MRTHKITLDRQKNTVTNFTTKLSVNECCLSLQLIAQVNRNYLINESITNVISTVAFSPDTSDTLRHFPTLQRTVRTCMCPQVRLQVRALGVDLLTALVRTVVYSLLAVGTRVGTDLAARRLGRRVMMMMWMMWMMMMVVHVPAGAATASRRRRVHTHAGRRRLRAFIGRRRRRRGL